MKFIVLLLSSSMALVQMALAQTQPDSVTTETLNLYKTYYPFVNVVSFGQEMRVSLPNSLFSDSLLKTLVLDKVQIKDKRGKVVVSAKNVPAATTPGDFILKPKKPLEKAAYKGLRGVASFHMAVPTQYQVVTLAKPGESGGGWTFAKVNRGVVTLTCANGPKCGDDEITLYQGDKVVEPRSMQRGASDATITLATLVSNIRIRQPKDFKTIAWTSRVVPDAMTEPKQAGVFYFEKPRPVNAGLCTQTPNELVKMFKFDAKRVENPAQRDQVHIDLSFSGPSCLNARMAKVYKALELRTAKRDLTGKISGLAGDADLGTTAIDMDIKETSFDVAKHPLLEPGDAAALRDVLQIRGVYNVHFPQIALKTIELDSKGAEKEGYIVRRAKKIWSLRAKGITDQSEVIAPNGLAMKPLSSDSRGGITTMTFPVEPRDLRQVVETSSSDILVPVAAKVVAGYKEIPTQLNQKDAISPAPPAAGIEPPPPANDAPVDSAPPAPDGPLGDAEKSIR